MDQQLLQHYHHLMDTLVEVEQVVVVAQVPITEELEALEAVEMVKIPPVRH